jgi:hypothetical protein
LNAGVVISTPAFSCHRSCVKVARYAAVVCLLGLAVASCSEKRESETARKETEAQPREDEIGEDCVAFIRATKILPASAECAGCSGDAREALTFRQMRVDRISCTTDSCEVTAILRAAFNPGAGGTISGGVTAWISAEQRQAFLSGRVPEGEQVYPVKITYKRRGEEWRAIEFDRAELK